MKKAVFVTGGAVVFISSNTAYRAIPNRMAYCASKGGVIAYTRNVAQRVAPLGATCNSIDPGGVLTPLNDCVVNDPDLWNEIMEQTPLKRWATAEEIAEWAYFMTVTNRFCTGQSIVIDGGESINSHFVWPLNVL